MTLPDHRATITQRLALQLSGLVLAGAYAPGSALREGELAARFEVSRHVVREVLRTLAADGLVEYASFKGARVPLLTVTDARDIYRSRRTVECGAEAVTVLPDAGRIDRIHREFCAAVDAGDFQRAFDLDVAFHQEILAASGSPRASAWLAGLMQALRLAHLAAPSFNEHAFADSVGQHAGILEAVRAGDPGRVRAAMCEHLGAAERALVDEMSISGVRPASATDPVARLPDRA